MSVNFSLAELENFKTAKKNIKIKLEGDIVGEGSVDNENIIIRTTSNIESVKNIKIIKIEQDIENIELKPICGQIYVIVNKENVPVNTHLKIKNMKDSGMIVLKSLSGYPISVRFDSLVDNDFNDIILYNNKSIELIWCDEEKMWIRGNEIYVRTTIEEHLHPLETKQLNFFGIDLITAHIDIKIIDNGKVFMYNGLIDWYIKENKIHVENKKEMEIDIIIDIIY